jgi:hypothetical protein
MGICDHRYQFSDIDIGFIMVASYDVPAESGRAQQDPDRTDL